MMDLFEDSPVYQLIEERIREKEQQRIQEERQRALEERQRISKEILEGHRQTIMALVARDFPKLVRMAKKQVRQVEDQECLQRLILRLITAHDAEEVEGLLLDLDEDEQG